MYVTFTAYIFRGPVKVTLENNDARNKPLELTIPKARPVFSLETGTLLGLTKGDVITRRVFEAKTRDDVRSAKLAAIAYCDSKRGSDHLVIVKGPMDKVASVVTSTIPVISGAKHGN